MLHYIIRDFDRKQFEARKAKMQEIAAKLQEKYGKERIAIEIKDQYYNMKEKIEPVREVVDIAYEAMKNLNIEPKISPIRGGTDGSILSARGLPTPNLFTGGHEYHSVREWASVQDMASAAAVAVRLAGVWAERGA